MADHFVPFAVACGYGVGVVCGAVEPGPVDVPLLDDVVVLFLDVLLLDDVVVLFVGVLLPGELVVGVVRVAVVCAGVVIVCVTVGVVEGFGVAVWVVFPPKKVVWWPLPVTECPVIASATVYTTATIAKASRPVTKARRHQRCEV